MKEQKWGRLQRTLLMAFTFAMTVVFAGMIGKVDVNAATMNVTVAVKDKDTNALIDDATVIFYDDYYDKNNPDILPTTKNSDGTYSVEWDDSYGYMFYKYRATAKGYKDSTSKSITFDSSEGVSIKIADILLEKDNSPKNKLEVAISSAQEEIEKYLNKDKYDPDQVKQINDIINSHLERIENEVVVGEETEETLSSKILILNGIVSDAKAELDKVTTSQDNINEDYADYISFVPESGDKKSLARKEYGKYEITLSRFEKGKFIVDNDADTKVNWDAKKKMFSTNAGGQVPFEIIDNTYDKGVFFNSKSFPADVNYNEAVGTISNASVTFTKDDKSITVTFDLTITNEDKDGDAAKAVEDLIKALGDKITLEQQDAVAEAKDAYDKLSDGAKARVSKESLDTLNAAIITIEKLVNEATIEDLQTQLKKLNDKLVAAEAKVAKAEAAQKAAEEKATKAEAAQKAAEEKAAKAEAAQKAAETKAASAVTAQKAAETKAASAVTAQKAAETKAANAEKAQKAAEQKADAAIKSTLPKLNLKVTAGKKKATLSWNKSSKGKGYIIYRSTSKNGVYQKIKTVTNLKTTKFTDKNLKSKQRYYYKICVYQGNVNGTLSTAKNVKVK